MKTLLPFLLLLPSFLTAQISGRVMDGISGKPLVGASVYINNSSIGSVTDQNGGFVLHPPPSRLYELVISFVGYEKLVTVVEDVSGKRFIFKLAPEDKTLDAVVVEVPEKDGWEKWGRMFREHFIGTSEYAQHCHIKNHKELRFYYSKRDEVLRVKALSPLIIVNKLLGYELQYDLELFEYDFRQRYISFAGYPFFTPLTGSNTQMERWERRRKTVYEGSVMHFLRSVYKGTMAADGFKVHQLRMRKNEEQERIKPLMRQHFFDNKPLSKDTLSYYQKVMKEPAFFEQIDKESLPTSGFTKRLDSTLIQLNFTDYLIISYINRKPPPEYFGYTSSRRADNVLLSRIKMLSDEAVVVTQQGSYFPPLNVTTFGYWSWSEKIATMLPFDYQP